MWSNVEIGNGYFGAIDPTPFWNSYYAADAQFVLSTLGRMKELLEKVILLLKGRLKQVNI